MRTLVSAAENGDLIVHRHELDCDCPTGPTVSLPACPLPTAHLGAHARARLRGRRKRTVAIPLLHRRVQRSCLVLARIPEHLETLLRAVSFRVERCVHPVYDFLVRAALEWNHLTLVVEAEVEV